MLQIPFAVGNNTLYITSGDKCYEISEYRNIKAPGADVATPTLCPFKWFGSLEGVITAALNMQIKASDARSFTELQEVIKTCTENITKTFAVTPPRVRLPATTPAPAQTERRRRTSA